MAASGKRIVRRSRTALHADAGRLEGIAGLDDDAIERATAADPVAAPVTGSEAWRLAEVVEPETSVLVTLRVDQATAAHFRVGEPGAEGRMAEALRLVALQAASRPGG